MDVLDIHVTPDAGAFREMRWVLRAWLEEACAEDPEAAVLAVNETVANGFRVSMDPRAIVVRAVRALTIAVDVFDPVPWPSETRHGGWLQIVRALVLDASVVEAGGTTVAMTFESTDIGERVSV
jgi:hypothetical protein